MNIRASAYRLQRDGWAEQQVESDHQDHQRGSYGPSARTPRRGWRRGEIDQPIRRCRGGRECRPAHSAPAPAKEASTMACSLISALDQFADVVSTSEHQHTVAFRRARCPRSNARPPAAWRGRHRRSARRNRPWRHRRPRRGSDRRTNSPVARPPSCARPGHPRLAALLNTTLERSRIKKSKRARDRASGASAAPRHLPPAGARGQGCAGRGRSADPAR